MATASQIKSLIESHYSSDYEHFMSVALQMAAHEARKGHLELAKEIRGLIEKGKKSQTKVVRLMPELKGLVEEREPSHYLAELVLEEQVLSRLKRVLREFRQAPKLAKFGLKFRRKVLFHGPPGTGKTMTAAVIAKETKLPFYTVQTDKLMSKFMGETSAKLRLLFDMIADNKGVYLFDEFDALASERSFTNDVGEIRRILNSLLQFIEHDNSQSFIIAATNNIQLLDSAIFRRFDDIIHYRLPEEKQISYLLQNKLGFFYPRDTDFSGVVGEAKGLSHAEISTACLDAIKEAIMEDKEKVSVRYLEVMIMERKGNYLKNGGV